MTNWRPNTSPLTVARVAPVDVILPTLGRYEPYYSTLGPSSSPWARFLVFGALVAATFKTFTPPEVLNVFTGTTWIAIIGLMLLAVLLSICSEADAFVAASFASFPTMAKVAFLALGPMVDLKLIPMFFSVFNRRIAIALIVVPIVSVYLTSLFLAQAGF